MSEEYKFVGKIIKITSNSKYGDEEKIALVGDINKYGGECAQCCNALDNASYEVIGRVYTVEELEKLSDECSELKTNFEYALPVGTFLEWLKERETK